jgi:hypothetical protein
MASLFAQQSGDTPKRRWNINNYGVGTSTIVNGGCPVYPEANRDAGPTVVVFGSSHCLMKLAAG